MCLLAALLLFEAGRIVREARRTRRLNRALHELRRPLQALALSLGSPGPERGGAGSCLAQARAALRELDAVVNGGRPAPVVAKTTVGRVLDDLARRWEFADVAIARSCESVEIEADRARLAAALDNLVANALRHGTGVVRVRVVSSERGVRFEVRDSGPQDSAGARARRDPRHGHGLRVVADVAAGHGGRASPASPAAGGGTIAAISLPVNRSAFSG